MVVGGAGVFVEGAGVVVEGVEVVGGAAVIGAGALLLDRKYQPTSRTTITATAMAMMLRWLISSLPRKTRSCYVIESEAVT